MRLLIVNALAASLVLAGAAISQETQPKRTDRARDGAQAGQQQQRRQQRMDSQADAHIATCLLLANKMEIELSEHAKDRLESDEVKQFAQKLIDDHKQAVSKLEQAAPQAATLAELRTGEGRGADRGQGQRREQETAAPVQPGKKDQAGERRRPGAQAQPGQRGSDQKLTRFVRLATEEHLSLAKEQLEGREGAKLDKAFLGQQLALHAAMLAKLKAAEQTASDELASVIAESKEMTQKHKEEAKKLLEQMDDDS